MLADLLPGAAPLAERLAAFRVRDRVPPPRLGAAVEALGAALRARTDAALGLPVGERVGFSVRGDRRAGPATQVEFVTTGVLLRRLQRDPALPGVAVVVLDEVAAVIQTGHYTKNISAALLENHDELKALVTEKVRDDPNSRLVKKLPGYEAIVSEVSETTLRVIIEMLSDPRMDELVSDVLRNNLEQIKRAVRDREHEKVGELAPADPIPATAPVPTTFRAPRPPP